MKIKSLLILLKCVGLIITLPYQFLYTNGNINPYNPDINLSKDELVILKNGFYCSNNYLDCNDNGVCSSNQDKCLCFEGYISFFNDILDYHKQISRCNYRMKKKSIALIYSIIGFGFLHFYLGSTLLGFIQLFLFIIVGIVLSYFIVSYSVLFLKPSPGYSLKFLTNSILITLLGLFVFLWWACDILYILTDLYTDSNSIPLYPLKKL